MLPDLSLRLSLRIHADPALVGLGTLGTGHFQGQCFVAAYQSKYRIAIIILVGWGLGRSCLTYRMTCIVELLY